LEDWGVDLEALRSKVVKRVFRAWVEDWEKECIKDKDAVSEVRLLDKYKGLVFYDADDDKTYTIESKNMEWYNKSRKKNIDGGWYLLATSDENEMDTFMVEDELCSQIADTPQDDSIEIIRRAVEEGKNEE
jgi:heat shock protein HspQ